MVPDMTIADPDAVPCESLVRTGDERRLARCGCIVFEYQVGGRQVVRRCLNWKRCGNVRRLDVTIDHAKKRWTKEAIRAWWGKVYG